MYYKDLIESQYIHLSRIEKRIDEYSQKEKYKNTHDGLICLRGIKSLTAMTLISEIGDINRFSHPKKLAAYVGLDIAEYSSGGKEKKLGITKTGNSHIRNCLVESQQILAKRPSVSRRVKTRRVGAPQKILDIATRCDDRIYKKSRLLMAKGKHSNKIKVACAREFTGFIWEVMKSSRENQFLSARGVTL
jgi:transposase